jgi:glycosyltransferase involved in cell wall biosynthesis
VPAGVTSSHPGVAFVGRVPDAQDFVRSAAVVPLISRAGTGVQLKTIEAFELGLPTVATSSSLRGVGRVPANCVVADGPAAFAAALERAASGEVADADGAAFYRRQRAELDARIRRGLEALGYQRHEALA